MKNPSQTHEEASHGAQSPGDNPQHGNGSHGTPAGVYARGIRSRAVAAQLMHEAGLVLYGSVSASLKIQNGRIVGVTYTVMYNTREHGEAES